MPDFDPLSPPPTVLSRRWGLFVLVGFLAGTALVQCAPSRRQPATPPPGVIIQPAESDALTDTGQNGGAVPVPSPVMPEKPLPWQKVPPCDPDAGEVERRGACYLPIDQNPPCARKLVQHEGKCYRTLVKPKPQPVSGEE